MLLRMYLRWAEATRIQDGNVRRAAGEEAGIKSATFAVNGGMPSVTEQRDSVHRLIRISPLTRPNGGTRRLPACMFRRKSTTPLK